jgi:hypothetical protein
MSVEDRVVLVAPCKVGVELTCPTCGAIYTIPASLGARVTRDSDGAGAIALRVRADKIAHLCGQLSLELVSDEAPREPGGPNDGADS